MRFHQLLLLCLPLLAEAAKPKNAVLLSQVKTLTLRGNGAKTSHRRVAAAPQLKCVSPESICKLYSIDVMRCTNEGSSYGDEDVEWSCVASLPPELKLGSTDVICEGYASSNDPYVLKGSCGVEYRLQLTDLGEKKYPDVAKTSSSFFSNEDGSLDWGAVIFAIIFAAVLGWILYSACTSQDATPRRRNRRTGGNGGGYGGGGGGGGGGGDGGFGDEPPPPYSSPYSSYKSSSSSSRQQSGGWNPGFGTGFMSGAAAGYMAGRSGNNNNNNNNRRNQGGSGWFGGSSWGSGSAAGPSSPGSSSSSSSQRESTGFGSTRRR